MFIAMEVIPVMDERIPIGTHVKYHGSCTDRHGEYRITAYSDFGVREHIFTPEVIAEHFPSGIAYDLWPIGVPHKFCERDKAIFFVRRESITPIEGS
jgi:hypothetical protein